MLENLRFHAAEENNDPEFAKALAAYGDVYVNDAFGTAHRAHASTVGVAELLPAYAGLLMEREVRYLSQLLEKPERPFAAVIGGAKVSGKIAVLENLMDRVDTFVIGGGMANTFLAARGQSVGKSLCERDLLPTAREILDKAVGKGREIVLPVDAVVAKTFAANAPSRVVAVDAVGEDDMILDIGPHSIEHVCSVLARIKTLVWNGPFGAFELEPFDIGTVEIAEAAAELTAAGKIITVAGGGDTVAALNAAGAADRFTYVSTAGGAFLEWLEGKPLPGVEVLKIR
jgi:phosphoglycerate kinase